MDRDGWPLIMGDDPGVPERVRAMANRRFRKLQTVPFTRLLAAITPASCGAQMREASCDERSARPQRKCGEGV